MLKQLLILNQRFPFKHSSVSFSNSTVIINRDIIMVLNYLLSSFLSLPRSDDIISVNFTLDNLNPNN